MGSAEGVVGRFGAFGETAQAVFHTKRADAVTAFCQDFVGVALVADVPDDFVARRVKDRVQGDGQFNHAKTCAQVAACNGYGRNCFGAHFTSELGQLTVAQRFHIGGARDPVQQGCLWRVGHGLVPSFFVRRQIVPPRGVYRPERHKVTARHKQR